MMDDFTLGYVIGILTARGSFTGDRYSPALRLKTVHVETAEVLRDSF